MFKLFEVKDKKFKILPSLRFKNIAGFFIISIITIIIVNLSGALKLNEKDLWKLYNLLIARFGLQQELPDIRDHEKQLDAQIELDVDKAIRQVTPEYDRIIREADKKFQPRYIEEANDETLCYSDECKSLAPPMRICAPWLDNCPEQ
jgi:hypothetical protein